MRGGKRQVHYEEKTGVLTTMLALCARSMSAVPLWWSSRFSRLVSPELKDRDRFHWRCEAPKASLPTYGLQGEEGQGQEACAKEVADLGRGEEE